MTRRVLVAYASRMGSTKEIAERVGAELMARGLDVDVLPCSSDPKPDSYDAVIIGSAIYIRRWDRAARSYLKQYAPILAGRSTWLFQSGPCGPGAETEQLDPPKAVARQMRKHGLPRPRTFGGRLDVEHATGPVSLWMGAEGPLSGDFRDWDLIRGWAQDIADELAADETPKAGF
jgi:menaquinone-dependent protoporphyrinogen oxidase